MTIAAPVTDPEPDPVAAVPLAVIKAPPAPSGRPSLDEDPVMPPDADVADKILAEELRKGLRDATYLLRSMDGKYRLTAARVSLLALVVHAPQRVSALARELAIRVPSVTEQVICLEREGLVDRHPDPTDSRAVLVAITQFGKKILEEELEVRTRSLAHRLAGLTKEEKRSLGRGLRVLTKLIHESPSV